MQQIQTDSETIQKAFTEWDRRYREDPDKFANEAKRLLMGTAKGYGENVTPYFLKLLNEIESSEADSPVPPLEEI